MEDSKSKLSEDPNDPSLAAEGKGKRELTRRLILQAGWSVPIILATAGRASAQTNHGDRPHIDSVGHADGGHVDSGHTDTGHTDSGHFDANLPHTDLIDASTGEHTDIPGEHGDASHGDSTHGDSTHGDAHVDGTIHGDTPHGDLLVKTIKPK